MDQPSLRHNGCSAMLLTITNTKAPATDLGYLLHKNPSRVQSFELSFGKAHVFYQTMASVYFGYHATRSIAEVIVATLYGFVGGLVGGAVFAWLYNQFAQPSA